MCDKRALRVAFRARRAAERSPERDESILQELRASLLWEADSFFVYCSVGSEVGTEHIIAALLAAGKRVCVPRIEGNVMLSVPYGPLQRGAFGIPAPAGGEDEPCQVTLTPLLAFDERGTRLGYGGGYYDAYFARRPHTLRVGLAYEAQRTERLPREAWDRPLHAVLTEKGLRRFGTLDFPPRDGL